MIVRAIDPALVDTGERLRALDPNWVEALAAEMAADGQHEAVRVYERGGRYRLIAGALRLAAARKLRWKTISASIEAKEAYFTEASIKLAEIKSNLLRTNVTVLDRAVYIATWRDIYVEGHDLPKRGGDRASFSVVRNLPDLFHDSLVEAAKRALDLNKEALYRALQIASIDPAQRRRIALHPLANHQGQLLQLAADKSADRQTAILDLILAEPPRAETVADAIAILDGTVRVQLSAAERQHQVHARLSGDERFAFYDLNEEDIERWRAAKASARPKLRRVK